MCTCHSIFIYLFIFIFFFFFFFFSARLSFQFFPSSSPPLFSAANVYDHVLNTKKYASIRLPPSSPCLKILLITTRRRRRISVFSGSPSGLTPPRGCCSARALARPARSCLLMIRRIQCTQVVRQHTPNNNHNSNHNSTLNRPNWLLAPAAPVARDFTTIPTPVRVCKRPHPRPCLISCQACPTALITATTTTTSASTG